MGYTFAVRAVNDGGEGPPDQEFATLTTDPPAKPEGLTAVQTGKGEVRLTWDAHPDPLTVTGYEYSLEAARDDPSWFPISESDSSTNSHTVTGLAAGTEYEFAVRAVNSNGSGEASGFVRLTVIGEPAEPSNFRADHGDTKVTLTWNDPLDTSITKYQYQQKEDGGDFGDWADIEGSDSGTISHIVRGLTNGTRYTFQVRGVNVAGNGTPSVGATAVPRLAKPTGLSAVAGDAQVTLSWDESEDTTIKGYQVLQHAEIASLIAADRTEDDEFGYSVAVAGDTAVIGVPGDDPTGDDDKTIADAGSVYVFTKSYGGWMSTTTAARLTANDGAAGDEFGYSVSVDGDRIIVGARGDDSNTGSVYVFTKPASGGWVSTSTAAKLTANDGAAGDEFGYSVSVDGNTVVVGARWDDSNTGSAYVFTKPATGGWMSTTTSAKLTASDRNAGDEFGFSVAKDGDIVAIGAPGDDHTDDDDKTIADAGSVYMFTKPDGGWMSTTTAAKLTMPDVNRHRRDRFGSSVALDGSTIVVGAKGGSVRQGAAYLFLKPEGGWVSSTSTAARLTGSDADEGDLFGISVALNGDTIVVGASEDGDEGSNSGSAYVFTKPDSGWTTGTETAKLLGSVPGVGDLFGYSVALDGDIILVGSNDEDAGGTKSVEAHLFDIWDWTATTPESDAGPNSHVARGLTNDVEYTFRVRAVNGGPGDASEPIAATPTAATSVPAKVRNFSAAQTGVGKVSLNWATSTSPVQVTGYQYKQDDGDWNTIRRSYSGTDSHTVSGLTTGTTYFAVRAVNGRGAGDSSDSLSVTIIDPPDAPTGLEAAAGDSQVLLSWDGPDDSLVEKYQYQQTETGDWTDTTGGAATTTSHLVTGLTNGTEYTFRVRAVNRAGAGAPSDAVEATPAAAVSAPAKPEDFSARQTGVGEVLLTWATSSNPLTVTGYHFIQDNISSEADDPTWTPIPDSDSSTDSYTASGPPTR